MIMQEYKNHKPQDTTFGDMAKASVAFILFIIAFAVFLIVWSY